MSDECEPVVDLTQIPEIIQYKGNGEEPSDATPVFDATMPPEVVEPALEPPVVVNTAPEASYTEGDVSLPEFDEIENAIDLLVNRFTPPPQYLRARLAQVIEKRRVEALMAGDYDTAEQQDKIASVLQMVLNMEQQKAEQDRSMDLLYKRWQSLQTDVQEINTKWEKKINDCADDVAQQRKELQERHDGEVDAFISQWRDPAFLRSFGKPSTKLMQLREQERAMAVNRMYTQAKEMRALADALQAEETHAAQVKMNEQMTVERHKLSVRHEKEVHALLAYEERAVKSMKSEKAKELRPVTTAIQQIKAKKTNRPKLPSSFAIAPRAETAPNTADAPELGRTCSPRTHTRYSHFRSEKKTTLLSITPMDDRTLAQMKAPPKGRAQSTVAKKKLIVQRPPARRPTRPARLSGL